MEVDPQRGNPELALWTTGILSEAHNRGASNGEGISRSFRLLIIKETDGSIETDGVNPNERKGGPAGWGMGLRRRRIGRGTDAAEG